MTVEALVLESPLATVAGEARFAPAPAPRRVRLRVVRDGERAYAAPLRLTARGRLVRTLLVFGAVSLLALMVLARLSAPQVPATHTVTVAPGQTLTQIAAEELPMIPVDAAVVRIQMANGLNGTGLAAGQDLVIPGATD